MAVTHRCKNSLSCTFTTSVLYAIYSRYVSLYKNELPHYAKSSGLIPDAPCGDPTYQDARRASAIEICVTDDAALFSALSIAREGAKVVQTAPGIRHPNPSASFLRHCCCHLSPTLFLALWLEMVLFADGQRDSLLGRSFF